MNTKPVTLQRTSLHKTSQCYFTMLLFMFMLAIPLLFIQCTKQSVSLPFAVVVAPPQNLYDLENTTFSVSMHHTRKKSLPAQTTLQPYSIKTRTTNTKKTPITLPTATLTFFSTEKAMEQFQKSYAPFMGLYATVSENTQLRKDRGLDAMHTTAIPKGTRVKVLAPASVITNNASHTVWAYVQAIDETNIENRGWALVTNTWRFSYTQKNIGTIPHLIAFMTSQQQTDNLSLIWVLSDDLTVLREQGIPPMRSTNDIEENLTKPLETPQAIIASLHTITASPPTQNTSQNSIVITTPDADEYTILIQDTVPIQPNMLIHIPSGITLQWKEQKDNAPIITISYSKTHQAVYIPVQKKNVQQFASSAIEKSMRLSTLFTPRSTWRSSLFGTIRMKKQTVPFRRSIMWNIPEGSVSQSIAQFYKETPLTAVLSWEYIPTKALRLYADAVVALHITNDSDAPRSQLFALKTISSTEFSLQQLTDITYTNGVLVEAHPVEPIMTFIKN